MRRAGKQRKPLSRVGKRKMAEIRETRDDRAEYLASHPTCEIGAILFGNRTRHPLYANQRAACTLMATGVHERKKRSQGGALTDEANLLSACNRCNTWVEDYPRLARILGLTVYSWENPHEIPKGFRSDMQSVLDNLKQRS